MMEGFFEGALGGLLANFGIKAKTIKPWIKALIMLLLFWIIFIPLFLLIEKIDLRIFVSKDFWFLSLAIYLFVFIYDSFLLWGNEEKEGIKRRGHP